MEKNSVLNQSINQSINHPCNLFDAPGTKALALRKSHVINVKVVRA